MDLYSQAKSADAHWAQVAQAFEIQGVAEALDDMAVEIPDPRVEEVPT